MRGEGRGAARPRNPATLGERRRTSGTTPAEAAAMNPGRGGGALRSCTRRPQRAAAGMPRRGRWCSPCCAALHPACGCTPPVRRRLVRLIASPASQAPPCHPGQSGYRCYLPVLAGFPVLCRTGPSTWRSDQNARIFVTCRVPASAMAEREGFEPSNLYGVTSFPGPRHKPD